MTNQEIKDTGLLIRNEQQIGGNTALRVGGVIEGIGYALDNKDAANGYYQAIINGGSISVNAPNYLLGTGGNLRIKMPAAGTTASTLTIGNANAVQLLYNGAVVSSDNTWEANEIISVFYDGTRFMASNSQGGGGDAEKIKYDNSQSGMAATNVQDALDSVQDALDSVQDEISEKVPDGTINSSIYSFTSSKYISISDGSVVSGGSSWKAVLDFIPIDRWLSIYTTAGGSSSAAAVAFYRDNTVSSYIRASSAPCGTNATVQVPADARYVRFSKTSGSHVITTYTLESKFDKISDDIDSVEQDIVTNYQKIPKEVDYLPSVSSGKGYKSNGIGTTIASSSNASFYSAKIPCKKGDIFGIITSGSNVNAWPAIITDSNNVVLWASGYGGKVGGVLEIAQENAAFLYVSSYSSSVTKLTKLAVKPEDTIYVDSSYAQTGMLSVTNAISTYTNYVGFAIPMLIHKGDVVRINFKSYNNYRGYILRNSSGSIIGSLSDTSLSANILFCWNGDDDVYLYANGGTGNPPYITKYARNAAITLKNYGRKMAAFGDSITSYDVSDIGELVRGYIGMSFLKTDTQIDWGNIAEGEATICNHENTTEDFTHSGTQANRTLPNQVLKLLQHTTTAGEQISWHINSDNSDHSIAVGTATGTGYVNDKPDLIYIAMGTNDDVITDDFTSVISQTYSQLDKLTICSSLRWCLETLQNVYPNAVIVCVTPIKRGTRTTAEMEAKRGLIIKMCNYMAIPVVDGYNISGFSPLSYGLYSSDRIHPNTNTPRIARSIASQVDALV